MLTIDEANNLIKGGRKEEEYKKDYYKLVEHCKSRGLNRKSLPCYSEIHHIIPRCQDGTDTIDNLVLFTYLEHIVAHILLWRFNQDNSKLLYAANMMLNVPKKNILDVAYFEKTIARIDLSVLLEVKKSLVGIRYNPIVCWEKDFLGDPVIRKTYNNVTDVAKVESNGGNTGWRLLNNMVDDNKMHLGYYWSTFGEFEDDYPGILDQYLKNPTPPDCYLEYRANKYLELDPIVCMDLETGNVLKIYTPYSDLLKDGFGITRAKNAAEKNEVSLGYRWSLLSYMQKSKRDKLIEYMNFSEEVRNLIKITPKEGKTSKKKILIYDPKTFQVLKVYNTALESKKDGFDSYRFSRKAAARSKGGDNNYNGHFVAFLKDWEYPEKLEEYYKNPPKVDINNSMSDIITILKCDIKENIVNVYENRVELDTRLNKNDNTLSEKIDTGKFHQGFLWYHPATYKLIYPERWKYYKETGELVGNALLNKKQILKVDSEFNILENVYDEYSDRRYKSGKARDTITYKGEDWWLLEKFIEKYPDKMEEYLKKQQNNK